MENQHELPNATTSRGHAAAHAESTFLSVITIMKKMFKLSTIVLLCISSFLSGCNWGSENIYSGQVSGVNGGTINAGSLAITLPHGIGRDNISISIEKSTDIPVIKGSEEQQKAYKQLRFIGPIYKITASQKQFEKSFSLMVRFDPSEFDRLKKGEILQVISISDDGETVFPKVVYSDLRKGVITVKSSHFSIIGLIAATPAICVKVAVAAAMVAATAELAYSASARNNPWQFIQPDNKSIDNIAHQLRLPINRGNNVAFIMEGFNKRFVGVRPEPLLNKRPFSGPETLGQDYVLCWDLANLYGSLLSSMARRPDETGIHADAMRFVTGSAIDNKGNKGEHIWIEIVIDGKAYVVDTASLKTPFRFIPFEKAYRDYSLSPVRMYTLQPSSLTDYDPNWYLGYIRTAPPPQSPNVVGGSIWNTNMGRMTLSREGKSVSGAIAKDSKITGESNGNYIRGFIIHPSGVPINFEMRISADGNSFTGNQGMGSNNEFKGNRVK